jgi:hypothetical protein
MLRCDAKTIDDDAKTIDNDAKTIDDERWGCETIDDEMRRRYAMMIGD